MYFLKKSLGKHWVNKLKDIFTAAYQKQLLFVLVSFWKEFSFSSETAMAWAVAWRHTGEKEMLLVSCNIFSDVQRLFL